MPSMNTETKNSNSNAAGENGESWNALHARIVKLAHRRSQSLLAGDDEDETFDRGARALRTLMSAAEVANRMKREEDKERHEQTASGSGFSEDDIEAAYRKIYRTVERLERDGDADRSGARAKDDAAAAGAACGDGGEAVAGERS